MDFAASLSVMRMNKISFVILLIQIICATVGFSQNPPWKANGESISSISDLKINWSYPAKFPRKVWVYELEPNEFSPKIISHVITLCDFTQKDQIQSDTNGMSFQNGSRSLSISFADGTIDYETPEIRYGPNNLAVGVPSTNELTGIAKKVLGELHIPFSDITGGHGTDKIGFSQPVSLFFVNDTIITNIPYRTVYFRRTVDGMPIIGRFYRFNVGEHGRITKILISWQNLKRIKTIPTISPDDVVNCIRKGDAIKGPLPTNIGDIDWSKIKSLTIKKATPSYQKDDDQLYPFLRLDVVVDTGYVNVEMGMDCPIFDENKP